MTKLKKNQFNFQFSTFSVFISTQMSYLIHSNNIERTVYYQSYNLLNPGFIPGQQLHLGLYIKSTI